MTHAHWHDDIELNFSTDAALRYLFGGELVVIPGGTVAAFWGAFPHQLIGEGSGSAARWLTVPLPAVLQWDLPEPFISALLQRRLLELGSGGPGGGQLFEQWCAEIAGGSEYMQTTVLLEVQARLRRLARDMPARPSIASVPRDDGDNSARAATMAQHIAQHFCEPLRVSDVAEVVHLHPHHAMAVFRAIVGTTVNQYLMECRIAEAKRLLITCELPIADVAMAAGFGSQSQFYELFTRTCGQPPASYRRRLRRPRRSLDETLCSAGRPEGHLEGVAISARSGPVGAVR